MSPLFVPQGQHDRIAIMAPGPSLAKWQARALESAGVFTICIGDAWRYYDEAAILYHADRRWWQRHNWVPLFYGQHKVSIEDCEQLDIKRLIKSPKGNVIDLSPSTVVGGGTSGYQAVGLALHYQPKEIILCGYDYKRSVEGRYNIVGGHPDGIPQTSNGSFITMANRFGPLAEALASRGIIVYNCTIDTALTHFPRRELTDVL